ncbi:MAG: CopD family protein, partial [Dehalococcoidia bacterium]|nr:CopD family protein [Dehalococcoidia bacterium]
KEELHRVGEQFRHLVITAIAVLVVTGVILTLSRLTSDYVGLPYVVVLVIKIALALYMFYLVRFLRPRTYEVEPAPTNRRLHRFTSLFTGATTVLVLGVIVFLLADILRALIERGFEGEAS